MLDLTGGGFWPGWAFAPLFTFFQVNSRTRVNSAGVKARGSAAGGFVTLVGPCPTLACRGRVTSSLICRPRAHLGSRRRANALKRVLTLIPAWNLNRLALGVLSAGLSMFNLGGLVATGCANVGVACEAFVGVATVSDC